MERRSTDSVALVGEQARLDTRSARLIARIRELVAEQRQLDRGPQSERRESNRREIDRLQHQLAATVKGELRD